MTDFSPIQVWPRGLLGFLQLKNLGQNPAVMDDRLSMGLDLSQWYLETNADDLQRYTAAFATGSNGYASFTTPGPLQVPAGEWWLVNNYTIRANTLLAGETVRFACGLVPQPNIAVGVTLQLGDYCPAVSGANQSVAASIRAPFFAPPGSELVIDLSQCTTAATIGFTGMVRYTRLDA